MMDTTIIINVKIAFEARISMSLFMMTWIFAHNHVYKNPQVSPGYRPLSIIVTFLADSMLARKFPGACFFNYLDHSSIKEHVF